MFVSKNMARTYQQAAHNAVIRVYYFRQRANKMESWIIGTAEKRSDSSSAFQLPQLANTYRSIVGAQNVLAVSERAALFAAEERTVAAQVRFFVLRRRYDRGSLELLGRTVALASTPHLSQFVLEFPYTDLQPAKGQIPSAKAGHLTAMLFLSSGKLQGKGTSELV